MEWHEKGEQILNLQERRIKKLRLIRARYKEELEKKKSMNENESGRKGEYRKHGEEIGRVE